MAELQKEFKRKDTFLKNWGAVIILTIFFLASWAGQFVTQLETAKQTSQQHGQIFQMEEFWPEFWSATFENWQSEWLQLTTQALLISGFSAYIFRKQDEEHFKTQLMIEELREEIKKKK
ncbi:MAG TPA: DUF6766 family protein [Verrucomicrobiae bacterium]|nr:DUF6766 family protein [Verrucomicrobiae bacterium]